MACRSLSTGGVGFGRDIRQSPTPNSVSRTVPAMPLCHPNHFHFGRSGAMAASAGDVSLGVDMVANHPHVGIADAMRANRPVVQAIIGPVEAAICQGKNGNEVIER